MRLKSSFIVILFSLSCSRNSIYHDVLCTDLSDIPNLKVLNHASVTIKTTNLQYVYLLIQDASPDTLLEPCKMPPEFAINNLRAYVSGTIKDNPINQDSTRPTYYFVITDISKQ